VFSHESLPYCYKFYNCPTILRCFLAKVFSVSLSNFNPRKITFLDGFWYKSIFPRRPPWPDMNSPMWNFTANLMMVSTWLYLTVQKSFVRKTSKKSKNHEYSEIYKQKFQHFPALSNVFFHMKRSQLRYLSTGKTSKNSRNSTYIWSIWYSQYYMGWSHNLWHITY